MDSEQLSNAIQLIKSGNKQAAMPILREIVQTDPNNENAWLWLYSCVDRPEQKKYCLEQALKINPDNSNARQALDKLIGHIQPQPIKPVPPQVSYQASRNIYHPSATVDTTHKLIQKPSLNRNMFWLGAIILVLLCVVGGGVVGWNFVYNKFFNQKEYTSSPEGPVNSGNSGKSWSQIGVFLLDNGNTTPLLGQTHKPAVSLPVTDNRSPIFILNDPQISLPNLEFRNYYNDRLNDDVAYDVYEDNGAYRVEVNTSLTDGVYCFAQYGASVAPGQAMMWCFQVGDAIAVNPEPTITATTLSPPDFRVISISYEKSDQTGSLAKPGWSDLNINLAIENYSKNLLAFGPISVKIHAQEGFDYDCYPYSNVTVYMEQILPSLFRTSLETLYCQVPTQTSGYTLNMTYALEVLAPNQQLLQSNLYNFDGSKDPQTPQWEQIVNLDIEKTNLKTSYPLINTEPYDQSETLILVPNQPQAVGDVSVSFEKTADGQVNANVQSNYMGGDTYVWLNGVIFTSKGDYYNCTVDFPVGPGQAYSEFLSCTDYHFHSERVSAMPSEFCLFINSVRLRTGEETKDIPSFLLTCFK